MDKATIALELAKAIITAKPQILGSAEEAPAKACELLAKVQEKLPKEVAAWGIA